MRRSGRPWRDERLFIGDNARGAQAHARHDSNYTGGGWLVRTVGFSD